MSVSRRDALKTFAATLGAASLSEAAWAQALAIRSQAAARTGPGLAFLTAPQHRLVDVLTELIIPADDRSPGASAAKVADFIDLLLSGAADEEQQIWRDGLAALDVLAAARGQHPFTECSASQQAAILTEISRREMDPHTTVEKLFALLKERTIQGYYTSEIGIHTELGYKGNKFLTEFLGCTHPEHMA